MATDTHTYQILLIEDSSADVGIIRVILKQQSLDHVLHVVKDGATAMIYIENAARKGTLPALDLLMLDMHLPRYNGEEILQFLRSTAVYAHLPVLVISSSDAPRNHAVARKHDAVYYFRKPACIAEFTRLGSIVRDILEGRQPEALPVRSAAGPLDGADSQPIK